jgi:lactate dehydrogenase-like 2-hydroxyacid dehydrogenase
MVGTGRIGRAFARIMLGFGCEVIGYDKYPSATSKPWAPATRTSLRQAPGRKAFFTREAISTICETTINSISEFSAGKPLSNEIKTQAS